jgi:hypothetical protein
MLSFESVGLAGKRKGPGSMLVANINQPTSTIIQFLLRWQYQCRDPK